MSDIKLSKLQKEIIYSKENKIVVLSSAASGKAQPNSTIIPTTEGYKKLGDIMIGDKVFNRYGKAEQVIGVYPQGKKRIYEIEFTDGRITRCCGDHLWQYYDSEGTPFVENTRTMFQNGVSRLTSYCGWTYNYIMPYLVKPLEFSEKEYEINPFIAGLQLTFNTEPLSNLEFGKYLSGSIQQRTDFCDGFLTEEKTNFNNLEEGGICFFNKNKDIILQAITMLRSLGTYIYYIVEFKENNDIKYGIRVASRNRPLFIENIKLLDEYEEMTCIKVDDAEELYVTNDYIITHNTTCLTKRAQYLIDEGINPNEMVLFTFTNAAADEMKSRIKNYDNMFIGTIHSYVNKLLRTQNFNTFNIIKDKTFDELINLLLLHPEVTKKIKVLLVDEAQDLTEKEYQLIFDILKPESFFIVGDAKQSIYKFREARPDILLSLLDFNEIKSYELNENYRNGKKILNFAKRIINKNGIKYIDNSIAKQLFGGKVTENLYSLENIDKILTENLNNDYGDWFILTRNNSTIVQVAEYLDNIQIPYEILTKEDLPENMKNFDLSTNTIKLLTIHGAKGLEADNVIVIGPVVYNEEERRISYVAATRARKKLYWLTIPPQKKAKKTKRVDVESWE